ncbi:TPA: single-stranded DNA-binding protein [Acinetobacter baumannii]|jgi:single-strand DNA-binding protein|uniref:single-stranded DNA-binding protein n=1 Tax=Acinetobacter radioresistens TaxID=40216 RepID=UPI000868B70E|nr:single-stranded DNA-binding protein [Acinetobacter radioresistens]ODN54245.1 single-stranded DNA-binding protein [Acinetobacter sp. 51m]PKH31645.1 single-stranded DNA-binding protein [Acinetobacter radioresistens]HBI1384573.1 single-stranded DNA-binding protein [Acinetobacter baumannii]HBI9064031.1 single-stranded DNA-binding protein [Acinetobacter baumannii]
MPNVNRAVIMGILGKDPEVKTFDNGSSIASFSVATSEFWKDKNTGERRELTEWHRIVVQGRLVDVVSKYLKKGGKVYIEGSLHTRKWKDSKGNDRETVEIKAKELQLL